MSFQMATGKCKGKGFSVLEYAGIIHTEVSLMLLMFFVVTVQTSSQMLRSTEKLKLEVTWRNCSQQGRLTNVCQNTISKLHRCQFSKEMLSSKIDLKCDRL